MNLSNNRFGLIFALITSSAFTIYGFNSRKETKAFKAEKTMAAPEDTLRSFPTVMVEDAQMKSIPLGMNELKVDIKVVGNIAVTTLDMTFFNNEGRVLEGELYFPLAAGQTVSRFAMEIDGKLREGVVAEKKEARVAFESTVRQKVDPGLLEWTKGNNFKARIYPIPANGFKRVLVSYTHELSEANGQLQYYMPMKFKDKLNKLDVTVEVLKQAVRPVLQENELHCFRFDQWNENYKGEMKLENVYANLPLSFGIPFPSTHKTMLEAREGTTFFYTTVHPKKGTRLKKLPKSLSLVWDVSGSAKGRNFEKETALLRNYLQNIGDATVELVTFSNEVHQKENFTISAGNCEMLISKLQALDYDGATQLGSIDFGKLSGEEIILSSDCLGNFGTAEANVSGSKPVYVWNSNVTADHSNAQYIADKSRGQYLDFATLTNAQALEKMTYQHLRFLGMEENPNIQITTDRANSFTDNFSIAGTVKDVNTRLSLLFGYGNEVTETIAVDMNSSMLDNFGGTIPQIWAQKRIAELDLRYELFKDEITRLGKTFGVVTRNTSLLILDRLEDYVTYRIPPPADMRKQYDKLVAEEDKTKTNTEKNHMETVVQQFNERKTWWNKTFKPVPYVAQKTKRDESPRAAASALGNSTPVADAMEEVQISNGVGNANTYHWSADKAEEKSDGRFGFDKDKAKGSVELENWDPATPYIAKLKATEKSLWYKTYMELRKEHENQPSFYIDVADFFIKNKDNKTALRILSNIAELDLENPQLLRILGHRLEQLHYYDLSISVFKEVKNLRPEEPQSYRDLGLVYALNKEDQKAVDELYYLVTHNWDGRFSEIESMAAEEMNAIIANSSQALNISAIDPRLIYPMPVDMRVVINWDTDACDIDLWVTDPRGEKCYYSNKLTAVGGRMSDDFTGGYGPEEFIIKKAIPGNYIIEANYFGNSSQSLTGATTIQVQMFTNYGRKSVKTQEITRRLETNKEVLKLATFTFKAAT